MGAARRVEGSAGVARAPARLGVLGASHGVANHGIACHSIANHSIANHSIARAARAGPGG